MYSDWLDTIEEKMGCEFRIALETAIRITGIIALGALLCVDAIFAFATCIAVFYYGSILYLLCWIPCLIVAFPAIFGLALIIE